MPGKLTSRDADSSDLTRKRLLTAAAQVFVEQGYHGATVREICRRAHANVALVNYYFGDKLELYTEVLRSVIHDPARMASMHQLFGRQEEPSLLLRRFIHALLDLMLRRSERGPIPMNLILHELARPTPAIARLIDEMVKPIHDRLLNVLSGIIHLPPQHNKTRLCAQSIIAQTIHYAHHFPVISRLWPNLKLTPETQAEIAGHISDFSLAYLREVAASNSMPIVKRKRK